MTETPIANLLPFQDPSLSDEQRVRDLLERVTLEEKVGLMAGSAAFVLEGVGRLNVPQVKVTDGPTGVRSNEGLRATVFPVGVAQAATWNPELLGEVASAIADEALAQDVHVILAPTINIVRTPLWGRNFETYSEDPFLAGALGAAYVDGLQRRGVGASLKHYAVNNQELRRMSVDAQVADRPLREIYLAAFEHVVKAANPWTVMASYNKVNGEYATQNRRLQHDILCVEWGWDGVVVSDWGAVHTTSEAAEAGCHLEMPGPPRWFGRKLVDAVRDGQVREARIDQAAERMIRLLLRVGALDADRPAPPPADLAKSRAVAARAAEEAVVLLRNTGGLLPLDPHGLKRVAVVGPNADALRIQGGGSSEVRGARAVSLLQAIRSELGDAAEVVHADGGDNEQVPPPVRGALFSPDLERSRDGLHLAFYETADFAADPVRVRTDKTLVRIVSASGFSFGLDHVRAMRWTGFLWPERDGRHQIAIRAPGATTIRFDGRVIVDPSSDGPEDRQDLGGQKLKRPTVDLDLQAGHAYPIEIDYVRPASVADLAWEQVSIGLREPRGGVEDAAALAATADAAIVVIGAGSVTEGEGYDRETLDLPGDQNALVEAVLAANPRTVVVLIGGAPYAMPWADHVPALVLPWLGGEEGPDALARILFGRAEPSGRLPVTFPRRLEDCPDQAWYGDTPEAVYGEGLFVGYRHFDRAAVTPLFPFGHGLTYTRFAYGDLRAPEEAHIGQAFEVSFSLSNVGQRPGKEVVQLYVRPRGPSVERPVKELKAFAKIGLAPGETREVRLILDDRAFAHWDDDENQWTVEPGSYDLLIGASAADIELQSTVRVHG